MDSMRATGFRGILIPALSPGEGVKLYHIVASLALLYAIPHQKFTCSRIYSEIYFGKYYRTPGEAAGHLR
jgi:hypothetical protein